MHKRKFIFGLILHVTKYFFVILCAGNIIEMGYVIKIQKHDMNLLIQPMYFRTCKKDISEL